MTFPDYLVLALIPSAVWLLKLLLIERYTFLYKGVDPTGPYVIVRLDKLTGVVHGFNWAGWKKVEPHSGYPGTVTPE